jgi:surface antigen
MGLSVAPTTPASATNSSSTLCSGYFTCNQGTFSTHGYQNHSSTSYWTMYPGDNCTNYVAFVESTVYGVATPTFNLGDGGQWASAASQNDVPVDQVPAVGSVAVWNGENSGIPGEGHVAVVEAVGPSDSYIVISQQHMLDDPDGYDWTVIYRSPARNQWEQWPSDFVHFSSGPATRGPQALTSAALTMTTSIVLRVEPLSFANDEFVFSNHGSRVVTPGVVTSLNAGGSAGEYGIGFQKSSLQSTYVLHITVSGSNVRVLHPGGPYTDDVPWLRITGPGSTPSPAVVTVSVRRGTTSPTASSTTTTTATTATTATTVSESTTTLLQPSIRNPPIRLSASKR